MNRHRIIVALMVLTALLLATGAAAVAATPAGVLITNQAAATYVNAKTNTASTALSNISIVKVANLYAVSLENDRSINAAAGQRINFQHILTNIGNTADQYDLSTENLAGDDFDLDVMRLHLDVNENGLVEDGEPEISSTRILAPGESVFLVVSGSIPGAYVPGLRGSIRVTAASKADAGVSAQNTDTAILFSDEAVFQFSKSAEPTCAEEVAPGEIIRFSITLTNVGGAAPAQRPLLVDGAAKIGFLVEDPLPPNVTLALDVAPTFAPVGSQVLAQKQGWGVNVWTAFSNLVPGDLVTRIGVLFPDTALGSNESAAFGFSVRVIDAITPGTRILNQARIDLEGDGIPDLYSNETCNTLKPTSVADPASTFDAVIRFLEPADALRAAQTPPNFVNDGDYQDVGLYRLSSYPTYVPVRDGVYLEVRSTSLNASAVAQDEILVTLLSKLTGDTLIVRLVETGVNTGIFRTSAPIILDVDNAAGGALCSADAPGACFLKSMSRDTLQASIHDPGTGVVLVDAATVDPLGVVFNSVTLELVAGAVVSIRTPDGELALDPDTGGTTVLEPQVTGLDGAYQFPRVYPGIYYIDVAPPAGLRFPSVTPAHYFAGVFAVGVYSYGQNGFQKTPNSGEFTLAAGDPALVVDIPVDFASDELLVLEKTTTAKTVQVGDFTPYTLRVRNNAGAAMYNTRIRDRIPFGFKYVKGSVKVDGKKAKDPEGGNGPEIVFNLGLLNDGQTMEITYVLMVSPGALDSDGINRAQAFSQSAGGVGFASSMVSAQVDVIQDGLFSDRAILFGAIYVDENGNRLKDEGELAVGGVRVYMEDGSWAITDDKGQYSLYGLKPGNHVVKPDPITLPEGMELTVIDSRFSQDPASRFVDLVAGDFHRADFAFQPPGDETARAAIYEAIRKRNESLDDSWVFDAAMEYDGTLFEEDDGLTQEHVPSSADGDISAGVAFPADKTRSDSSAGIPASMEARKESMAKRTMPGAEDAARQATAQQAKEGVFLWPEDGVARDGRFLAVIRGGVTPVLTVNGVDVAANKLGEQVINNAEAAQVLAWYGVPLEPGPCQVVISGTDMFGNRRVLAEKAFVHPGPAAALRIAPLQHSVPADGGRSTLPMEIQINDASGIGVRGAHFVTLEASDGRFTETDIQAEEPGHQVRVEDGRALVHLQSSLRAGQVDVAASAGSSLNDSIEVAFSAPLRPIVAAGILDVSAHFNDIDEKSILPTDQADGFADEIDYQGRGAIFLKGKIKGGLLLTLAYDSDKDEDEILLRDIDPDAYYPIYGDASVKGYDAQSRSKIYVRLEKGKTSVMWGDFRTDYNTKSLARVDRTLTGANARAEVGRTTVSGFYAEPDYERITEEIRGNGTAAFYRIAGAPIEENSETIDIITRSRENPGLVRSTRTLTRLDNYQIDPVSGYITFHEPIPSVDENNNPVYVRIAYDTKEGAERHAIYGARLEQKITENLFVGGSHTQDEHPESGSRMSSGHVRYQLKDKHGMVAEYAHMAHEDDDPSGDAYRVEMDNQWTEKFNTNAKFAHVQSGFDNASGVGSAGRQELTAEAQYKPYTHTTLTAEGLESKDLNSDAERRSAGLLAERKWGKWRTEAGGRFIRQMETADGEDFYTYRLGLGRDFSMLDRKGQTSVSWEQDVSNSERRALDLNADWQVHKKVKLYGSQELINSLSGITSLSENADRATTTFGVSSDFLTNTKAYSEYRIRGAASGRETESATGVRRTFDLKPGLSLSPQLEYVNTMEGPGKGDAFASSVGMVDKRSATNKKSARLETRLGKTSDMYGARGAWGARLDEDWSGVVKEEFNVELPNDSPDVLRHALTFGLARRPVEDNIYHWIGMYQWKESRHADGVDGRRAHILSSHHNWQATEFMIVSGRLAGKWQRALIFEDYYESLTSLGGLRLLLDINDWMDLDLHGGALNTDWQSTRYSGGAGFHFNVFKNARLGLGYNFAGFTDSDLDPEKYYAEGFYIGLQYKFDESLFQWLAPDGE